MSIARPSNGTPADEAAVRQLQADVLTIKGDIREIKQSLAWLPPALDKLKHVIDQGDRLIEATSGPDGVPAWHATLGALGEVTARLSAIEAATAGVVQWLAVTDGRLADIGQRTATTGRLVGIVAGILGAIKVGKLVAWWQRR